MLTLRVIGIVDVHMYCFRLGSARYSNTPTKSSQAWRNDISKFIAPLVDRKGRPVFI